MVSSKVFCAQNGSLSHFVLPMFRGLGNERYRMKRQTSPQITLAETKRQEQDGTYAKSAIELEKTSHDRTVVVVGRHQQWLLEGKFGK